MDEKNNNIQNSGEASLQEELDQVSGGFVFDFDNKGGYRFGADKPKPE